MQHTQEKHIQIRSSKLMNSLFLGNFKAAFAGKGVEFQDFREYSPGDDAKYIDWLTSSREGNIVMRRYREEKQAHILCVIDVSESLFFDTNHIKIQQLDELIGLLGRVSILSGEAFGGYCIGKKEIQYIPPRKQMKQLFELKKYQDISPRESSQSLSFEKLLRFKEKRAIVFVVSDSLRIDEKSFKVLALKHDVVYIHISTVFENTLEGSGIYHLRGRDKSLGINLDDTEAKKLYQKKRQDKFNSFSKNIHTMGADIVFLDESKSLFTEFLKLMKRRES